MAGTVSRTMPRKGRVPAMRAANFSLSPPLSLRVGAEKSMLTFVTLSSELPAVVHGGQDPHLISIEFNQVGDDALYRASRNEGRIRVDAFEVIEDFTSVLPGFSVGCLHYGKVIQSRSALDLEDVGHDFAHPQALMRKGGPDLA